MRLAKDGPIPSAIAAYFNTTPDQIEGLVITVGLPMGTAILHTFCCHEHMAEQMKTLLDEPYINMTTTEN